MGYADDRNALNFADYFERTMGRKPDYVEIRDGVVYRPLRNSESSSKQKPIRTDYSSIRDAYHRQGR